MKYVYPQGKSKALTFSYDDGQAFDRRLVEILNRYGLKGTFHLNSGSLGIHMGFYETVDCEEIKMLYEGHEVACHGKGHLDPWTLPVQQAGTEIGDDRRALERLCGKMVQGLSYAYGHYTELYTQTAKSLGIKYARTTEATGDFYLPADFMKWHPTCHHTEGFPEIAEHFLALEPFYELPLMYVWGHSFEFNADGGWEMLEETAQRLSGQEDIWYATNLEICNYVEAVRALEFSADGKEIYNPSAVSIWIREGSLYDGFSGELIELKAGDSYRSGD